MIIEPGILPLFRAYMGTMFVLLGLGICGQFNAPQRDYFNILMWGLSGLLFWYAAWKPLKRREAYFPLALLAAAFGPIFVEALANVLYVSVGAPPNEVTRLYVWMIFALLIISGQYGMRAMWGYTVSAALLPLLLAWLTVSDPEYLSSQGVTAVARLFIFGFAGYCIVRLTQAQRTSRREIEQKNAQLAHYALALEQLAITRERNRLARELHDTLAHTLSAVNVQLSALEVLWENDPSAARESLRKTQTLTRDGLNEARRALSALRASPLDELGLRLALERLAAQAAQRAGTALTLDLPTQIGALRPEVEQCIYRIAEEALNNAVRHAGARALALSLRAEAGQIILRVSDDGAGFDASASPNGHYGLIGMRERAALVNGTLTIDSAADKGTQVVFSMERNT